MREFVSEKYQNICSEFRVIEKDTNVSFIIVYRHCIFEEKDYNVSQFRACREERVQQFGIGHEKNFNIYRFLNKQNMETLYVDEETATNLIEHHLMDFLNGTAARTIEKYLYNRQSVNEFK